MFSDVEYIRVSEEDDEASAVEIPCEPDGTLLLSTLAAQFPGACGLKYRHPSSNAIRGVRLSEGRLHPPSEDGWGKMLYLCVFPKENKRKIDDVSPETGAAKTKRLEKKFACSDLICLGLPWKCTEESIKQYFEQFGEVVMVQLKKDKDGTFKGFGFIRFASYTAQMRALAQRHNIDGRWVDVRIPNSKEGLIPQIPCKVFIGRCTEDMTAEDFREYFSQFGEVTDVFVPKPFRAFSFVTFLDPEVAQSLCGQDHVIKGASVSVSSAAPKLKPKNDPQWRNDSYGPPNSWNGPRRSGPNNRGSGPNGNNIDALNMQNLGINPNGGGNGSGPMANLNLPISLVAAALNQAGWGGFMGGQGDNQGGPSNWQNGPPASGKNWNNGGHQNWNQNGPTPPWMQGGKQGWNQNGGGGNWGGNWNGNQGWGGQGNGGGPSGPSGGGQGGSSNWSKQPPQS